MGQQIAERLAGVLLTTNIELREPLEQIRRITPDLLRHLQRYEDDIRKVQPRVFEEIVAELLASMGWDEIKLVGRRHDTSADILAGFLFPGAGSRIRVFIETKRWRDRIGVEVFNQVLDARIHTVSATTASARRSDLEH